MLTVVLLALFLAASAQAARPVDQRIQWLTGRVATHLYICRHGKHETRRWHCAALEWSRAELREARAELHRRDWAWQTWLPDKWARIGACETGYGKRPGDWRWDSGRYVSAFGVYRPAYASFAASIGLPAWDAPGVRTPREQYRVALAIWRKFGFSGWGCRNA